MDRTDLDSEQAGESIAAGAPEYIKAPAAAELLDVKLATLYAYTSRGLVRSIPGERGRARLYLRRDLERLCARRDARSGHGPVAAAALQFGEPVLDSSISAISPAVGPVYRGHEATRLALADAPFEAVAELLWSGELPLDHESEAVIGRWRGGDFGVPRTALQQLLPAAPPPLLALSVLVPLLATRDPGRFVERPAAVLPRARTLIRRMAAALAIGRADPGAGAAIEASLRADRLAGAVGAALGAGGGGRGEQAINRALVLGADHELNASTFAARVVASTGADIYACVSAALASLSGPRHGGASDRVEALVAEIGEPENAERVVHERQRRGESIDGFSHPLYPAGDPRGAMLVSMARELEPASLPARTCLALIDAMQRERAAGATIDTGLVALTLALDLPRGAAVGMFAIARCAGWVAHVLEQYEAGYLVRPRARYLAPLRADGPHELR